MSIAWQEQKHACQFIHLFVKFFFGICFGFMFFLHDHYMANLAPKARIGIRDISKYRNTNPVTLLLFSVQLIQTTFVKQIFAKLFFSWM